MFRLIEYSSGQFVKHIKGTSSKSAHLWDRKIFTTVRVSGYKWSWYYYNNIKNSVHAFS